MVEELGKAGKARGLRGFERIKCVHLEPEEWTVDNGGITFMLICCCAFQTPNSIQLNALQGLSLLLSSSNGRSCRSGTRSRRAAVSLILCSIS